MCCWSDLSLGLAPVLSPRCLVRAEKSVSRGLPTLLHFRAQGLEVTWRNGLSGCRRCLDDGRKRTYPVQLSDTGTSEDLERALFGAHRTFHFCCKVIVKGGAIRRDLSISFEDFNLSGPPIVLVPLNMTCPSLCFFFFLIMFFIVPFKRPLDLLVFATYYIFVKYSLFFPLPCTDDFPLNVFSLNFLSIVLLL